MSNDDRLLLLHDGDNVLVCCQVCHAGETVMISGKEVVLEHTIETGHKIARHDIEANDRILKYGAAIGTALEDIRRGGHVHIHNMRSDYMPSHTRDGRTTDEGLS